MKSRYSSIKAVAALLALLPATVFAGPTASQGVLLMGFRSTDDGLAGAGTYVVVNIGQAATYRTGTAPATITNINSQLAATFGVGWASRADIQWGIGGCPSISSTFSGDTANTLYLSRAQTVAGVPDATITINTSAGRSQIAANLNDALGLVTAGSGFDDSAVSGFNPLIGIQSSTLFNNWRVFLAPGGTPGKAGGTGTLDFAWDTIGLEANPLQTISLLRFGGAATGQVTGSYLGYFKIETNGNVTFYAGSPSVSYTSWATTNVGNQPANLDFDGDGIPNGNEWFMGTNGNAFTANPQLVAGTVTWTRASGNAAASSVIVQTSTNLATWTNALSGLESGTGPVLYTPPAGLPAMFVRLSVTP